MMNPRARRSWLALPIALAGLTVWGSVSAGQQPLPTLSADLAYHPASVHTHRVIVQAPESALGELRRGLSGLLRRDLRGGAVALEVNDAQLDALQRNPLYAHISGDLPVTGDMAVTNQVTGAMAVWGGTPPGYTGAGVGIAILDSGIAAHDALDSRVVAHVDLVTDKPGNVTDVFGHGTHLAGIAAGNRTAASSVTPAFSGGSAPAATLIDVRVLGDDGSGLTSDVIAGIDWVIDNRAAYNIRVINLSLGHPVTEPSATDPLCEAVERAVAAGITVVVSAGNDGQTSAGEPVLGGITSPGNSSAALTVGAIDTKGTLDTSDDVVAAFSSKGPTPYEMVVKPDVVAPGARIVSLEAQNSYIGATYPQWHIAGKGRNVYLRLSGTSMSTAVVSGGAALLLQAMPSLTPAQVKMLLQLGARFMPAEGLLGGGAGSVDFSRSLAIGQSAILRTTTAALPLSGKAWGLTFRDDGTLIDRLYGRTGIQPVRLLDLPGLLQNAENAEPGVLRQVAGTAPFASAAPNYIVWGNTVSQWSTGTYIVWGNTIATPAGQYVVWGNSSFAGTSNGSYIVWGNTTGGVR
jgi:serine protease AprX